MNSLPIAIAFAVIGVVTGILLRNGSVFHHNARAVLFTICIPMAIAAGIFYWFDLELGFYSNNHCC